MKAIMFLSEWISTRSISFYRSQKNLRFCSCHLFQPVSISKNTYQLGVSIRISIVLACLSQSLCTLRTTSCGGIREVRQHAGFVQQTWSSSAVACLDLWPSRSIAFLCNSKQTKIPIPQIISPITYTPNFSCFYLFLFLQMWR